MGNGFAIQPTENTVYTPIAGEISSIFPTQHALGIMTPTGLEVLLHMGVDTVDLKGEPFTMKVKAGQKVKAGDVIAIMDLAAVKAAGKGTDIIVALTNGEVVDQLTLTELGKAVTPNQTIGHSLWPSPLEFSLGFYHFSFINLLKTVLVLALLVFLVLQPIQS